MGGGPGGGGGESASAPPANRARGAYCLCGGAVPSKLASLPPPFRRLTWGVQRGTKCVGRGREGRAARTGRPAGWGGFDAAVDLTTAPPPPPLFSSTPPPQGEPLIVTLGWAATAAMFSFSLALVVWGRSGL